MPYILKHEKISDDLRIDIVQGVYQPGEQLPSLRTLAQQYNVSTQPVRNAMRTLRDEGLIHIIGSGSGVYVAKRENTPRV